MPDKTQTPTKIEKPWAVYGLITKFIGRVSSDHGSLVNILYCDEPHYGARPWKKEYVQRFNTFEEAIDCIFSKSQEKSKSQLTEQVLEDFPKTMKQESLQLLHNTLASWANLLQHSQSLPKLTGAEISKCPYADAHARYQRDEGPLGANPFRKDDGFVHPHKKY